MKQLVTLLSVCCSFAAAESCRDKYPYSTTELNDAIGNSKWDAVPRNFKCGLYCDFEQNNQTKNGVLQESVKSFLASDAIRINVTQDKIGTCLDKAVKYGDPCDSAFAFFKCYIEDTIVYGAKAAKED